MYKNNKGFTYIELIVASIILTLAVAGVYAALLSATQFVGFFRHDVMAATGAEGWLDKVRAENSYDTLYLNDTGGVFWPIPDTGPEAGIDDLHLFWGQLETEVNTTAGANLTDANPPTYDISIDENYSGGAHSYNFTRVTITVIRDERGM